MNPAAGAHAPYDDILHAAFERRYREGEDSWSREPAMRRLVPLLLERLARPGGHVLDIGAGRGPDTVELLAAGHRVTATDLLRLPEWDAIEHRWGERVAFLRGDITELPLPPARFDAAVDNGVLHHQDPARYPAYLAAVRRTLRPGGLLALSLFSTVEERPDGVVNRADDGRISRWFTAHETRQLLGEAHFETLALERIPRRLEGLAYLLVVAAATDEKDGQ
ncbi:class I SAM-dependent methyltransferase [Streptomyces monashensis]|uniref:Methyltransferase domain-containing protein n=1 Tax=Streptomyces monashensis TaxID=1678012 RepID=A0A1S2PFI7_9ACTN|nr:class I SAM-dependent methyltransferase [Streptomyces monashensis]OIJ92342.1 hypothetical protein BIV23_39045 [Streptomyces monashensis]